MNANSSPLSTAAVYQPSFGSYGSGSSALLLLGTGSGFATGAVGGKVSEQTASMSIVTPQNRVGRGRCLDRKSSTTDR